VQDIAADRRPQQDRDGEQRGHQEPVAHVADHRVHRHAGRTAVTHHLVWRRNRLLARHRMFRVPGDRRAGCGLVSHLTHVFGRCRGRLRDHRVAGVHRLWRIGLHQRIADVLRNRLPRAVEAAVLDPPAQLGHGRLGGIESHGGRLPDRVSFDADHPGTAP